jgi:hypothetical protein
VEIKPVDSGEFRLRSVALAAYAPATLFGLAEGAMLTWGAWAAGTG